MLHPPTLSRRTVLVVLSTCVAPAYGQTSSVLSRPTLSCQLATRDGINLKYKDVIIAFGAHGLTIDGIDPTGGLSTSIPYDDIIRLIHRPGGKKQWWKWLLLVPAFLVSGRLDFVTIHRQSTDGQTSNANLRLESIIAYQLLTALERATGLKAEPPASYLK